jgi:threonine synthase
MNKGENSMSEILKTQIGRTPLVRALKLEKDLGVSKIFLKLEGNNPYGHREDRLAYLIIREALSQQRDTICIGTVGTVGFSLAQLSEHYNVKCVFVVPETIKKVDWDMFNSHHVKVIKHGKTYEDSVMKSRQLAQQENWYDANPGLENNMMNMYAFKYIARELHQYLQEEIDYIYCQTSNGSSISGLHMGFKDLWLLEDIQSIPHINAVSTDNGNAIIESYKQGRKEIVSLSPKDTHQTRYNKNMIQWKCFNGQDALNAVYNTHGEAIGITDQELIESSKRFRSLENIRFTIQNSFPIAALYKLSKEKRLRDGIHVVILNDAKVDLKMQIVKKQDLPMPYNEFLKLLDTWLLQFTDPFDEMTEAVENAFEKGYVLCAYYNNILAGIAIVSRTGFDKFFPKYHLSYIATKKDIKGRGIATQLMEKVIEVTNGDLTLHVEIDNKRAIKLYEKMGLQKKYYRMYYKGPVFR